MSKLEPYLHITDAGFIWWPLKDAIRLGAGYRSFADDHAVLEAELRAPNQRVRANERTLIGAFSDDRLMIERPMTFERDGLRYVDAGAFLTWLAQYIAQTQAKIAFPNDLVRAVRHAKALAASTRTATSCKGFESLTLALEAWFDQARDALPDELSRRVEKEFLVPWDALSPAQRRSVAIQWDYQSDPATQADRKFWWDFYQKMNAIEQQIEEWEAAAAPSANDLALKETKLGALRQALARMEQQQRQSPGDYYPERKPIEGVGGASSASLESRIKYMAFPKAMTQLAKRLDATPEEMAGWVFVGPKDGGLAAYLNANELDPPPRFHYSFGSDDDFDYLSPLMACWFREDDIAHFEPTDHFITGKVLIERWGKRPGIQPKAFICAKIAESRLMDMHPITGLSQGSNPKSSTCPPIESALFVLSHVEEIEVEDFARENEPGELSASPFQPVTAAEIRNHFPVLRDPDANDIWWKEMMREAKRYGLKECRVGGGKKGPGGSLWRPDLVGAWLVDRYAKNRDGMSPSAVRAVLKKIPGCEDAAEELFPADE